MNEKDLKPERQAIRDALRSNPEGAQQLSKMMEGGRFASIEQFPKDEPMTVICMPWGDRQVRGCTRGNCDTCRRDVALAPSTVEMVAAHKGPIIVKCMECALPELMAGPAGSGAPQ